MGTGRMRGGALPALAALLAFHAAPAAAQAVQTPTQALAQDAGEYARRYGVAPDEALRRLRAQEESVAATDAIARRLADRLAGISVEHEAGYRIVVLLTGDAPVPDEWLNVGGMVVPVHYRTGAVATRGEVVAAIERRQATLRAALPRAPSLGLDQRTGELVATVNRADMDALGRDALVTGLTLATGVPVRLRPVDLPERDASAGAGADTSGAAGAGAGAGASGVVGGGARVVGLSPVDGRRYACTTGFVVTDGVRAGVVTAAHCPDALAYVDRDRRETPLAFVDGWGWGHQDVQLHLSGGPLRPAFFADTGRTASRPVTAVRAGASVRAGDWLCHRGERTGYSCAAVELTDFAPAGDLCGGACTPTWVTVAGPTCRSGDSGGPVFVGTVAVGLVKGASYAADGRCNFYYYMSTDFLPGGWEVMRAGASNAATLRPFTP